MEKFGVNSEYVLISERAEREVYDIYLTVQGSQIIRHVAYDVTHARQVHHVLHSSPKCLPAPFLRAQCE